MTAQGQLNGETPLKGLTTTDFRKTDGGNAMRTTTLMRVALGIAVMTVWLAGALPVGADDAKDYFIQSAQRRHFDLPQDARAVGMGGSSVPTTADVSSLLGNPAGLGWLEKYELSLSYRYDGLSGDEYPPPATSIDDALHTEILQLAIPLCEGELGVLGLGGTLYQSDIDDAVDTDKDGFTLHLAYAKSLCDTWSLGYALSYYNDEEDSNFADYEMDFGLSNRLGVQFRPSECVLLGLDGFYAFGDTDSDVFGNQDGDRDSWGLNLGVSYQILERTLLAASVDYTDYDVDGHIRNAAVGINQNVDEDGRGWGTHLGAEQGLTDWLALRGGYRYKDNDYDFRAMKPLSGSANYHALSTGAGFKIGENMGIDYGFEYRFVGDGDLTQTVTAKYKF